jgi:hypothetical protein
MFPEPDRSHTSAMILQAIHAGCRLAILRSARLLVPRPQRAGWFAEWKAELAYIRQNAEGAATSFCLGAFRDAFWLRRNSLPSARPAAVLASPYRCIAFLAALASAAVFFPFRPLFGIPPPSPPPPDMAKVASVCCLLGVAMALLIACRGALQRGLESLADGFARPMVRLDLGLTSPVPPEEHSPGHYVPRGLAGLHRWVFLAAKSVLLVLILVFSAADLGAAGGFLLYSCVLVFRWAADDHRQRCPVCLRRLTNPTRIGEPSHTFLDWYGTEFMCDRGHGLLHVPEIQASCYNTQHWLYLDPSWSNLFS